MVKYSANREIIVVKDLVKRYANGVIANDHINMKIKEGEIVGIIGPNGAGKTTLIKQLTGELLPTEGDIHIMGFNIIEDPSPIKPFIGVCPQEGNLIHYLTVWEHIYYFARLKGLSKEKARKNTDEILKMLNLKTHRKKRINELSGGLKRRVFVGISLVNEPRIVFLDEPTAGLDPISRMDFWRTIKKITRSNPETTIIITTHYLEELDYISDRLIFLNNGKIVLEGNIEEVRKLILDYDIKITLSKKFKDLVMKALMREGVMCKIKEERNKIHILLSKKDISTAISEIARFTSDIVVSSPTLDEVFIGVIENEKNNN
ncbi:MAG: ABC transporter ATP-binding protein [Thermoplasmata archaeon]|nr:ABC transporter ATP-binding protein [Thermoplasmata archaeon]